MNKINILGINISTLNKKQALNKIEEFLSDGRQHQVVTPNPEIILGAQNDEEFFHILNSADLAMPDGIGLKFASWLVGKNLRIISGSDLIIDILKIAEEKNLKVAILNWSRGLSSANEIKNVLSKKYPKLNFLVLDIEKEFSQTVIASSPSELNLEPDIIFSTLGAPRQEKIIYHTLKLMPSLKLGMGVGGGFDFLTGKIKRAPKFLRALGLEWLWRLTKQPTRWKRIVKATLVFPYKFFIWRFILPFLYRENVACLLFKKGNGNFKILIVERAGEPGHWQLPQGGTDGESVAEAGVRELKEEIGTAKFKIIKVFKNLHSYEFGDKLGKYDVKTKTAKGYRGQKQNLFIAEFTGSDNDIEINYWDHSAWKWVDSKRLAQEVHPVRKESAKIFLEKFNNLQIKL